MTRAREWAIAFAISAIVLLIPALWVGWHVGSEAWSRPPRNPGPPPSSVIVADAALGYTMRPDLDVRRSLDTSHQNMRIVTDRIGTRVAPADRSRHVPKDAILVVGDSQMFGWGLEYEDTFPAQLSARLGMPVISAGVTGYGPTSAYRRMKALLAHRPRAIVIGHYFDHSQRAVSPCYPGFILRCLTVPHVDARQSAPTIREPDADKNAATLAEFTAYYEYMSDSGVHTFWSDVYWTAKREWARYFINSEMVFGRRSPTDAEAKAALSFLYERIRSEADAAGIPIVAAYIPNYFVVPTAGMPAYLTEVFRQAKIPVADPTNDLRALQAADPEAIKVPNDGHLAAIGHKAIVDAVVPLLAPVLGRQPSHSLSRSTRD